MVGSSGRRGPTREPLVVITLLLGGTRSGKSMLAERLARDADRVTYVATARAGDDVDLAARIEAHRARRPPAWSTVELDPEAASGLAEAIGTASGTVLVDSLGAWLAAAPDFEVDVEGLVLSLTGREGDSIVVSEEVGLSVHPATEGGRRFVDQLGTVNQAVAAVADRVGLVVAGCIAPLHRGLPHDW